MDVIDDVLESRGERELQPAVLSAVALGRATLKRYYVKTELSDIYSLAVALHPSSKLDSTSIETAQQRINLNQMRLQRKLLQA
ncbi:putative AC9 transposase [Mycena venus]|uniref:Putative AC9 transposase n=1 Tax=Mycena venus TaxID=2733690 RepID=A0A8H7CDS5_9AGAR|nr:putative AC9 transposase [Mycena venus]